jgi:hypothetical protein
MRMQSSPSRLRRLRLRRPDATAQHRIAAVLALALLAGGGAAALTAHGRSGAGRAAYPAAPAAAADPGGGPLTGAETRRAAVLAGGAATGTAAGTGGTAAAPTGRDVHGKPGAEVLESEREPLAKGAKATADTVARVSLYDYAANELITRRVDVSTGRVLSTARQHGVQPPATADEVRQAVTLLLADPKLGPGLRAQYRAATGKALTSPDQLDTQATVFDRVNRAALKNPAPVATCGTDRCVQLLTRVPDGKWIDTSRIVIDLSARRVAVIDL